jgi:hypothetical protein
MYEMSKSTEESMQHEINQLKHALEKSQAELNRYLEHESPLKKEKENERLRDLEVCFSTSNYYMSTFLVSRKFATTNWFIIC